MADTSLVFNLVARDQASGEVSAMGERFNTAAAGIGIGFAGVLGASIMQNMDVEAAGDKLAAQLGAGPAEAAMLAEVSASIYKNAWGESVDEVNLAIKGVYQNIGDTSAAEGGLEGVTTKALALASTFDQDLTMATAAVGQMIRTGLADNADEAFDILTVGLGTSADKAGDLLETFNEYSTQFRRVGLDAQTATGLISQGLENGAKDADQVADALGQFGEIALAGGSSVDDAFKSIGLNADDMAKAIGAGGTTAEAALGKTLDALRGTTNEQVKLNAAGALFGDPGKIMGDALYALDPAGAAAAAGMDKAAGAAGRMADKVGSGPKAALEEFKRSVMAELGEAAGGVAKFALENKNTVVPLTYAFAGLAAMVLVVKGAMMVYAAVSAVVTAANALISASCWTVMGNYLRMMGIGLMAYARIAGAAVLSATMTAAAWVGSALVSIGTWIAAVVRAAVVSAAQFVLMAARAVAWAVVMAAQWLIAMGPVGWVIAIIIGLVALIIANWDTIKEWTGAAWTWVWDKIKMVGQFILDYLLGWKIVSYFLTHWDKIKTGLANKLIGLVAYVKGLPGRIKSAVGDLGSLLSSAGRNIVTGLWNGISGMGSWLAGKLTGFAKSIIPGPIAKALGISSPSKVMATVIGRWIPAGIVDGIESGQGALERTMSTLVQPPSSSAAMGMGRQLGAASAPLMSNGAAGGMVLVRVDTTGAEGPFKTFIRKVVRVDGRGNVQLAFGEG